MIFSPKVCTPSSDFPYLVYRNRPVPSSRNIFSKLSCTPRAYVIYSLCLHRCSSHPICCSPFYDDWRRYHGNESSRQPDAWPAREADPCLQPAADAVECSAGPVQYVGHRRRRPFLRPDRTRRSRIHSDARYPVYGFSHWPWQRYQCPCCALSRRRQPRGDAAHRPYCPCPEPHLRRGAPAARRADGRSSAEAARHKGRADRRRDDLPAHLFPRHARHGAL